MRDEDDVRPLHQKPRAQRKTAPGAEAVFELDGRGIRVCHGTAEPVGLHLDDQTPLCRNMASTKVVLP